MKIKITYSRDVRKCVDKYRIITYKELQELIKKLLMKFYYGENINLDVKRLSGKYKDLIRIRKGKLRVLLRLRSEEMTLKIEILKVDFRGRAYK